MVARQTLTLFVWVQILDPQPNKLPSNDTMKVSFDGFCLALNPTVAGLLSDFKFRLLFALRVVRTPFCPNFAKTQSIF